MLYLSLFHLSHILLTFISISFGCSILQLTLANHTLSNINKTILPPERHTTNILACLPRRHRLQNPGRSRRTIKTPHLLTHLPQSTTPNQNASAHLLLLPPSHPHRHPQPNPPPNEQPRIHPLIIPPPSPNRRTSTSVRRVRLPLRSRTKPLSKR